jgi:hypothetical protein
MNQEAESLLKKRTVNEIESENSFEEGDGQKK